MKKIFNYLMLLSGAAFLLSACNPTEENADNQIVFDGKAYAISAASMECEDYDVVALYFDSNDVSVGFALRVGAGEYRITKSGTFNFDISGDGTGTFLEGWFEDETTEAEVVSGTVKVSVSGDVYHVEADCVCDGGKKLSVSYNGALEYYGPTGTTTFSVGDMTFPVAFAEMYPEGKDEESGMYATNIWIWATDGVTGDQELDCDMLFFHSTPALSAGDYDCGWSPGNNSVYVEFDADDYASDVWFSGMMSEGKVNVAISGDVYTITFDGAKFRTDDDAFYVTGAYTGTVMIHEEDSASARLASAKPGHAKTASAKSAKAGHSRHGQRR